MTSLARLTAVSALAFGVLVGVGPAHATTQSGTEDTDWPFREGIRECEDAWQSSQAQSTCTDGLRVSVQEGTALCRIEVTCSTTSGSSSKVFVGAADEVKRLHNCDGELQFDMCSSEDPEMR